MTANTANTTDTASTANTAGTASTANTATVPAKSFRARTHHYSGLPVKTILSQRMRELGLKNADLQLALDYSAPNVIAMLRNGAMRLPPKKVGAVAKLLELDPVFLLGKVIAESDAELWAVISSLMGKQLVTANELALIKFVRSESDGHDINLLASPCFVKNTTQEVKSLLTRKKALMQAVLERKTDRGGHPGRIRQRPTHGYPDHAENSVRADRVGGAGC